MSVYVVGHKNPDTDSVVSAFAYVALMQGKDGEEYIPCMQGEMNPETTMLLDRFEMTPPGIMTDGTGKQLVLVDHSDLAQAPDNLDKATLIGVIDHHKVGDITTNAPIHFWAMPVGCTATVLKAYYELEQVEIEPKIAGLMLAAILSDTVNFKSPTCTPADRKAVAHLQEISGVVDTDELYLEMLKAKSQVAGFSADALLNRDYKDFEVNGIKLGVGQLELATLEQVEEVRADLLAAMRAQKGEDRHSVLLMLTDVVKEGTELLIVSDAPELIAETFKGQIVDDAVWVTGMMSRKKQVVPALQDLFSR